MLSRRAACAFPRDLVGIDLLIPIFKGSQVSVVLIQVSDTEKGDSSSPKSAVEHTRPGHVFEGNLKNLDTENVLRVYLSLGGVPSLEHISMWMRLVCG